MHTSMSKDIWLENHVLLIKLIPREQVAKTWNLASQLQKLKKHSLLEQDMQVSQRNKWWKKSLEMEPYPETWWLVNNLRFTTAEFFPKNKANLSLKKFTRKRAKRVKRDQFWSTLLYSKLARSRMTLNSRSKFQCLLKSQVSQSLQNLSRN